MTWSTDQAREMGRRGGQARAARADMREVGSHGGATTVERHGRDHMARIGRAGARATIAKHGARYLADLLRAYRYDHPTDLELAVDQVLRDLGLVEGGDYTREAFIFPNSRCHHYVGDFVLRSRHLVIYADGEHWHENNNHTGDRLSIDRAADATLGECGWRVLRLPEVLILGDRAALLATLREALL